jgi:hypothetical protein
MLFNERPDISVVEGDEVDNYFYSYTIEAKDVDKEQ